MVRRAAWTALALAKRYVVRDGEVLHAGLSLREPIDE